MAKKEKTVNILLIEDKPGDTRLFQERLKELPQAERLKLITAETGQEGLKKAKTHKPALILIDTRLPDMDGFEVCRQVKKIKGLPAKIIIYTGLIDAVDAGRARKAGADDYVVKTLDFSQLFEVIEKLV